MKSLVRVRSRPEPIGFETNTDVNKVKRQKRGESRLLIDNINAETPLCKPKAEHKISLASHDVGM